MWIFLVTEIMFFGGLFMAYTLYRAQFPNEFAIASNQLDVIWGGINTVVLIGSSLTMALAVYFSQIGDRAKLILFLLLTMVLGTVFLGIKAVEYSDKFEHNLFPGASFQFHGPGGHGGEAGIGSSAQPEQHGSSFRTGDFGPESVRKVRMFFWIYFAMTGLHALHMIIGLGILSVLVFMAYRRRFTPEYHAPVELTGLYWHFVDIVWIFLFPLLYLVGGVNLH
jgi:cytochrome c oxidase subunit 3